MMQKILLALLVVSNFLNVASASDDPLLEQGLLNAMRLKPGTEERLAKSGAMIRAYVSAGYLNLKPAQRADYTDYRLFKKPATLMGHTLVVMEEEYMSKHVGCCVSEGLGITIKIVGSTSKLERFARENGCTFDRHVDVAADLKSVAISVVIPKGDYATVSCRERDIRSVREAKQ